MVAILRPPAADLATQAELDAAIATRASTDDPRLSDARTPTGGAGGVLSGTYPDPGFAVDMAEQAELIAHQNNTANPHVVTKTQVGLSLVDNTSDVNKPVSTAQVARFTLLESPLTVPVGAGYFVGPTPNTATAVQSGWAYGAALWNPTKVTADALEFEVTVAAAGSTFRPIVWRGDLTAFLADGGLVDTSTTGIKTVVLGAPVVIPRGWSWWGGLAAGMPTLRSIGNLAPNAGLRLLAPSNNGTWPGAVSTTGLAQPQIWNGQNVLIVVRARIA